MCERRICSHAVRRQEHVISVDAVKHAVGPERELIATMTNVARRGSQQCHFIKLIVAIGIAQTIKPLGIVRVYVESVVREEQSAAFEQVGIDRLDANRSVCGHWQGQSQKAAIFSRDDNSPAWIKRYRHPRTLARLSGADEFHREARQRRDVRRRRSCVRAEGFLPLVVILLRAWLDCRRQVLRACAGSEQDAEKQVVRRRRDSHYKKSAHKVASLTILLPARSSGRSGKRASEASICCER